MRTVLTQQRGSQAGAVACGARVGRPPRDWSRVSAQHILTHLRPRPVSPLKWGQRDPPHRGVDTYDKKHSKCWTRSPPSARPGGLPCGLGHSRTQPCCHHRVSHARLALRTGRGGPYKHTQVTVITTSPEGASSDHVDSSLPPLSHGREQLSQCADGETAVQTDDLARGHRASQPWDTGVSQSRSARTRLWHLLDPRPLCYYFNLINSITSTEFTSTHGVLPRHYL